MAVNLSALAGAGQQFFDDSGNVLTGGKLYSYVAGTTTPQATFTSASGATAHTNPIILNAAGRVATGEIWLTAGLNYKFVLHTANDVLIASYDNITGINGTGITSNAVNVTYDPAGTSAVATTVQTKLRESVSVKDFGAVGDGVANDTTAIQAAHNTGLPIYYPAGTYLVTSTISVTDVDFVMQSETATIKCGTNGLFPLFSVSNADRGFVSGLTFDANALGKGFVHVSNCPDLQIINSTFHNFKNDPSVSGNFSAILITFCPNARITNNFFYDIGQAYGGSGVQPSQYRAITQNTSCDKTIVSNNVFQSVFGGYFLAEFEYWESGDTYVVDERVLFFESGQWNLYRCIVSNTASALNQPPNATYWVLQNSDVQPTQSASFTGNICRDVRDNSVYFLDYIKSIVVTGNSFIAANDETIVVLGENITITGNNFVNTKNKAISLELGYNNINSVTISGNSFVQDDPNFSTGTFIIYRNAAATNKVGTLSITGNNFKSPYSVANASYIQIKQVDNLIITGNVFDLGCIDAEIVIRAFNTVGKGLVSGNVFLTTNTNARPYQNESASSDVLIVSNMMNGRILANNVSELIQLGFIQDTGSNIYFKEPISRLVWANDVPSTGTWTRGDIVFHQFPTANSNSGWVYTNTGWKDFGYTDTIVSGTYTPVLTNVTNVSDSTAYACQYIRVGNVVTVSGVIAIDPIATGNVQVNLSLPIASNFTNFIQAAGTIGSSTNTINGIVKADTTNDTAQIDADATATVNRNTGFTFTYQIL